MQSTNTTAGMLTPARIGGIALLLSLFTTATAFAQPSLQYSQDGKTFHALAVLSGAESASDYYNYSVGAGHPGFGVAKKTETVSLYWDSVDHIMSMIFIAGSGPHDRGSAKMKITGLPQAALINLSDHGVFTYAPNTTTLTGRVGYKNSTDGFTLGGLESSSFTAKMTLSSVKGTKTLRLTDGDPTDTGTFQLLDLHKPLYIKSTTVGSSLGSGGGNLPPVVGGAPVPEPTGLGLLALLGGGLLKRRRCN